MTDDAIVWDPKFLRPVQEKSLFLDKTRGELTLDLHYIVSKLKIGRQFLAAMLWSWLSSNFRLVFRTAEHILAYNFSYCATFGSEFSSETNLRQYF